MCDWSFQYGDLVVSGDEKVYRPGEDTILILSMIDNLRLSDNRLFVDFGCGSGIISLLSAKKSYYSVAIDIDFLSTFITRKNSFRNNLDGYMDIVCTSYFLDIFRDDVNLCVASNPPYLPVDLDEKEDVSWAGGLDGSKVITNLLRSLKKFYDFDLYLVVSTYTNIVKLRKLMDLFKYRFEVLDKICFPYEEIFLYHIYPHREIINHIGLF